MGYIMKRLCTICARGGSKGVPGKNTRMLLGKPLIAHSIDHARQSGLFDHVAVSSDSDEILNIAKEYGADVLVHRPDEMANDKSAKLPAIQHCARQAELSTGIAYDTFCDLDATSPLRSIEDIQGAVALMEAGGCDNVITGAPAHRSPYFNLVERVANGFVALCKQPDGDLVRRQDAPECYDCNASIYVWNRESMFALESVLNPRTAIYVMPDERSRDIDSPLDFELVEFLMRRKGSQ